MLIGLKDFKKIRENNGNAVPLKLQDTVTVKYSNPTKTETEDYNLLSLDTGSETIRLGKMKENRNQAQIIAKDAINFKNQTYMNAIKLGKSDTEAKQAAERADISSYMQKLSDLGYKTYDISSELTNTESNLSKAIMLQKTSQIPQRADFAENSKPIGKVNDDFIYNYINLPKGTREKFSSTSRGKLSEKMTDDEIKTYTYLYNTEGRKSALQYFDYLEAELNQRQGQEIYEKTKKLPKALTVPTMAVVSGVENFVEGTIGYFDKERPQTALNYATSEMRDDLGNVGKGIFDIFQSAGNMAPSILISYATAGIGGAVGAAAGTASKIGSIAGSSAMGLSAAGNAYQSALKEGKDKTQARAYGTLVGLAEGGMQYVIGGVSKLGGGKTQEIVSKIEGIDKAFVRVAARYGKSFVSEGFEEGLQEAIDPIFRTYVFEDKYDAADIEDIMYSALIGGITGGIFETGDIVSSERARGQTNKFLNSILTSESKNLLDGFSDKETVGSNVKNILEFSLSSEVTGGRTTKQATFEKMSDKGYTPSSAFESNVDINLNESGLSEVFVENIKTLIDKLDTGFASSWYDSSVVGSAKKAVPYYIKSVSVAQTVNAAGIAKQISEKTFLTKKQAETSLEKANKLLPLMYRVDIETGTAKEKADRIVMSAEKYIDSLVKNTPDVSQNYMSDMVTTLNETVSNTPGINAEAKTALVDLLINGKVDANIKSVLADPDVTNLLSTILGTHIDSDTQVADIVKKAKSMLSIYKAGKGTEYSFAAKQKSTRAKHILNALSSAKITDSNVVEGFKNSIYNGKLTKAQAQAIAENETAFNLFTKSTGGALDTSSTIQDMINAADLVAGFKLTGKTSPYYNNGISEIIESDTLVPDGEVGIYDSDNGRVILNKNATQEQKNAYILAHRILNDTKKTDAEFSLTDTFDSNNKITVDIDENTRAEILKKRSVNIAEVSSDVDKLLKDNPVLFDKKLKKTEAQSILRKVAEHFGALGNYSNNEFEIEFEFGSRNLRESTHKQKSNYYLYAQMLSNFSAVIDNAVGVEVHNRNKEGYKTDDTLKNVYVLCSAFQNKAEIVPVKLEIKEFIDKPNRLYIAITLKGIKKDRFMATGVPIKSDSLRNSPVNISISELFSKINPVDTDFTKYIPESMLTSQQKEILNENGLLKSISETYDPDFKLSGSGRLHFDGSKTKLTALQSASIKALEAYADALGLDIYIETNVDKNINGWFDSKGIHISLEAGTDAKGTLLFTAAHELTHFIKKYSPDKWETFAEFIVQNYMDKDISTGKLIRDQQLKAKRNGINLSTDEAFHEVIADACETMLVDGSALEKLSELRKSDVTLYERIKYFISNLAYKIKQLYKNLNPSSNEARYISQMNDTAAKLQQMFNDALYDAAENYQDNGITVNNIKFSFNKTLTGMANDSILPYSEDLKKIIESKNGIIVDNYDKLVYLVNLAFDEPQRKCTGYFGIVKPEILVNIEKNIPNKPNELKGSLFKENREYSIAITLDSIRHLVEDKSLTREDVIDYLDRLADVIIDFDSVSFDYYYGKDNQKHNGLLFKKQFPDGITQSFNTISNKTKSIRLVTIYLENGAYKKRKSAKSLPMQNIAPAHTLEARASQTFNNKVSQDNTVVNSNSMQDTEENTSFSFKNAQGSLSERIFDYISRYENSDAQIEKTAQKYKAYVFEKQERLSSSILSAENLENESAAGFLTKLFNDTELMNSLAHNDLELAIEISERVGEIANSSNETVFTRYAGEVNKKLYSSLSADDLKDELSGVLKNRYQAGLTTAAIDSTSDEGKINMEGVADKTFIQNAHDWWNDTKRARVDSGEAIKRFGDKLGNDTIYHLYNNTKQSKQAVNIMLTKWQTDIEGNCIGESLKDIFLPIVENEHKNKNFCLYMQHLNNAERALNDKAIFPEDTREESLRKAESLLKSNPEFKMWAEKVYKYIDGLLNWQLDSGLISREQYDTLKASNSHYVPAFRVQNMNTDKPFFYENVMISKGIARAKGGAAELMPLLEALTLKTTQIVNESRMNLLANEMINTLKDKGMLTESLDGYEVSDAALQEFVYQVTATKKNLSFGPEMIDGKYATPKARKKLSNAISELFTFKDGVKNEANTVIRDFANNVTLNENVNTEDIKAVIDKLVNYAVIPESTVDSPYYTYPELRRRLRDTKIYVSPEIVSEITDYSAFKKSAFGKLTLTTAQSNGVISVDSIYQDLSLIYPDIFDPNITNPTDQLVEIHRIATETLKKPEATSFYEFHKNDIESVKKELVDSIYAASVTAIKSANAERIDIDENTKQDGFVLYDINSSDNFSFRGEQEGNRMAFYVDGVRHTADIGRGIFEGLKHIDNVPDAYRALLPIQKANTLFKKLVTSYNPFFSMRNFVRDLQDAVLFSEDAIGLLRNLPRAYKEIANNGEMWKLYQSLGGVGSSYFDFKGEMDLASRQDGKAQAEKAGKKVVDFFEYINLVVEQAPRLSEFINLVKKSDGSYAAKMKALYASADVTVNFGRSGIGTKLLNSTIVPFLNPGVQGASKFIRRFTETKGVKKWIFLAGKLLALGFSFGAINDLINHDDEEYEQLTDYQKQNNILIKVGDGIFLKIPKGRSVNVFSINATNVIDTLKGKDVDWIGGIKTSIGQIAPNDPVTDNLVMPFVNAISNKTWYGGEIESQADDKVMPSQRYDETTDYFSRWLGKVLNYSPKKIHYILDSYTGVVGDYVLPIFTPQGAGNIPQNILLTVTSNLIVDSKTSNRISSDYYSLIDNLTYEKNDLNNENNTAAAVSLRFLNSQSEEINKFYDEVHKVNGGNLSPNEKAAKSRELKVTLNGIMLNAMDLQTEVYKTAEEMNSKYAYKKGNSYYDESGDEITYERYIDIITRETYRKCFGAEYALKMYDNDVLSKANKAVTMGASYDGFYDAYFDIKNIEGEFDIEKGTFKTGTSRKNKWDCIDNMNMSQDERAAIAKVLFDVPEDKIEKATVSGISMYEYIDFVCNTGTYKSDDDYSKKDKVLSYINKLQLNAKQKDTLYLLAGYSEKGVYDTPWH